MSDIQVLSYSVAAALSTCTGGLIPVLRRQITEGYLSVLMAFSAGIILATSFHELIPEAIELTFWAPLAIGTGFIIMYAGERLMIVHACPESHMDCEVHHLSWSAFFGLSVHSLIDGVAIAAGFEVSMTAGAIVAIAVLIHEFPEGLATASILLADGYSRISAYLGSVFVGLMTPLGTLIGLLTLGLSPTVLGVSLGFSAGTFVYIATSDLLPEAHQRFRSYWLIAAFALGYLFVVSVEFWMH